VWPSDLLPAPQIEISDTEIRTVGRAEGIRETCEEMFLYIVKYLRHMTPLFFERYGYFSI